jgi:diaminopimelate epimerase
MSKTLSDISIYSGTGNTFVIADNRDNHITGASDFAKKVYAKHSVDGLLLIENSVKADFKMRIINRDGSEADMCGNGSRCAAHWAHAKAGFGESQKIETGAGILDACLNGSNIKIKLTDPKDIKIRVRLELNGFPKEAVFMNTGVPHTVIECVDIRDIDVQREGKKIRYSEEFKPDGTNVSFFQKVSNDGIQLRTYERGVEAETKSCGTGATAAALAASIRHDLKSPIRVLVASGDELTIYFVRDGLNFSKVYLEGIVEEINR